jgi:hypothetical protein
MARVNHYQIAEQLVGESVEGAGTMSSREVAKAQVHATLAIAEILGDVLRELSGIREQVRGGFSGPSPSPFQ